MNARPLPGDQRLAAYDDHIRLVRLLARRKRLRRAWYLDLLSGWEQWREEYLGQERRRRA